MQWQLATDTWKNLIWLFLKSRGDQLPARAHQGQVRLEGQGCLQWGSTPALSAMMLPVKKSISRWVLFPGRLISFHLFSVFHFICIPYFYIQNSMLQAFNCHFQVCRTDLGVSSCYCKPGYGRKSHRGICKSEIFFNFVDVFTFETSNSFNLLLMFHFKLLFLRDRSTIDVDENWPNPR